MVTCLSITVAQLIYHVILLADPPYGHDFKDCELYEKLARQFGFQRLDLATGWQLTRLIVPDILVTFIGIYAYVECLQEPMAAANRTDGRTVSSYLMDAMAASPITVVTEEALNRQDAGTEGDKWRAWLFQKRIQAYLSLFNNVLLTALLALCGIMHPCLFSAPYFAVFLFLATYWSLNHTLAAPYWLKIRKGMVVYSGIHVVLLYLYQFEFFQGGLPPESFPARLLGFTVIVKAQCEDVRAMQFDETQFWPIFVNPLLLMGLYGVVAIQLRLYFEHCDKEIVAETEERIPKATAVRAGIVNRQRSIRYGTVTTSPYLMEKRKSLFRRGPSIQLDKGAFATVIQFITRQSYVMQLFMMMGWSISYHSWSTFVLLLIACAVWMVPDSRKFCLKLSPFVAIYAEILLVLQYIWGLNLTQEELPDENPRVLRQLGFEKPRGDPPCVPLMTKTMFTIMFWVTLRQHLQESAAQRRERIGLGLVNAPFNIAFSSTYSGIKKPKRESILSIGSPKSSRSHSPLPASAALKVQQFGSWLRKLIAKYWVLINCGLLLFISLRTPVVAYRIIYAFFFLTFVNCFQISFRIWRKLLYPFWMTMIVYCMAVLTLIYTYQFHGFPEMWRDGTGLSYDVLESIGLQQFTSGELLLKLLTPISFLIFTIVQVNFFHKDLMERTLKLQNVLYPAFLSRASILVASLRRRTIRRKQSGSSGATGKRSSKGSKYSADPKPDENHSDKAQKPSELQITIGREHKLSGSSAPETTDEDEQIRTETETKPARKTSTSLKERLKEKSKQRAQHWMHLVERKWKELTAHQDRIANLAWRVMEIHIGKCVALLMMGICVSEVSAVNIPYTIFIAIMLPMEKYVPIVSHVAGLWTSFIVVVKMLYQMKFVKQQEVFVNCSDRPGVNGTVFSSTYPFYGNKTVDPAAWAGFHKAQEEVSNYFKGYLCLIVLMAFQSVVMMRQKLFRKKKKLKEPLRGVLLPEATRESADDGIPACLKYFINYFFYKFGLEICFLTTVATVGIRSDFISILYSLSLIGLLMMRRTKAARIWPFYVIFLAIMFPFQYFVCVGIPPSLCSSYPWYFFDEKLVEWLHLPSFSKPPDPIKLVGDFFQLLFACCQMYVFRIELGPDSHDYPGGVNTELVYEEKDDELPDEAQIGLATPSETSPTVAQIPVPDFISYSKSYLDLVKFLLFVYLYWATLAIVFVAGVSRVTLFAMGYVVACFMFLWVGNELFLKPLPFAVKLWNLLIGYNVVIIFIKTSLQVVGCVYLDQMYRNYCWVIQLFGIACLKTGIKREADFDATILNECNVPLEEAGILFDGICFFFLLLQRRIVCSHYFKHVIAEFKAQQVFASRGFELISQITMKEIEEQRLKEMDIVHKIKKKMDKIKQSQKGGPKGQKLTKQKSLFEGKKKQQLL